MAVAPVVFWLSHEQLIFPATSLDICRRRPRGRKLLGPKNAPIPNPTARLLQSLGGKSSQITFVGSAHIQYGFLYTGPGAHFLLKNWEKNLFPTLAPEEDNGHCIRNKVEKQLSRTTSSCNKHRRMR